jgi:hypothetical protein
LWQKILTELKNNSATKMSDQMRIREMKEKLQSMEIGSTSQRGTAENIHKIIEAIDDLQRLSIDLSTVRLELDEPLKIWERKWSIVRRDERRDRE